MTAAAAAAAVAAAAAAHLKLLQCYKPLIRLVCTDGHPIEQLGREGRHTGRVGQLWRSMWRASLGGGEATMPHNLRLPRCCDSWCPASHMHGPRRFTPRQPAAPAASSALEMHQQTSCTSDDDAEQRTQAAGHTSGSAFSSSSTKDFVQPVPMRSLSCWIRSSRRSTSSGKLRRVCLATSASASALCSGPRRPEGPAPSCLPARCFRFLGIVRGCRCRRGGSSLLGAGGLHC